MQARRRLLYTATEYLYPMSIVELFNAQIPSLDPAIPGSHGSLFLLQGGT